MGGITMGERKLSRETLAELLIGTSAFPEREELLQIKRDEERATKREGVWIVPALFSGRPYPQYQGQDNGDIILKPISPQIPALILETTATLKEGKGIVALHQHAGEFHLGKSEIAGIAVGKSGDSMHFGMELAQQKYTVICFDFPAFEERQYPHSSLEGSTGQEYAHYEATLNGSSLMGCQVLDTMAAVDVLQSMGINDIGVIGHSMGGISSYYAMASDKRIKAGVTNCGLGSFRSVSGIPYVHNPTWFVPGFKQRLGELQELFAIISERPYLVSAAHDDAEFTIKGVQELVQWGKRLYRNQSLLQEYYFEGEHSFPRKAREHAYQFLKRYL